MTGTRFAMRWPCPGRVALLALVFGCERVPETVTVPVAEPPPAMGSAKPARRLPDGRVEYRVLVRADGAEVIVPLSLEATSGKGRVSWTRSTKAAFRFDAAADRFVVADDGEPRDEHANAIFPGSPQEIAVPVTYAGETPKVERIVLRFVRIGLAELASRTYVRPAKGPAGVAGEAVERAPLGERVRHVDAYRWLNGGFFLREAPPPGELSIEVEVAGS